jgi:serine/threonine protein kinase
VVEHEQADAEALPRGAQPLEQGDPVVLDGYRLVARLGEGGQGRVYLALNGSGERVAVKALHPDLLSDPFARKQLADEVAAARRVPSFCTARLLDSRLVGRIPYLVTEFVDGPSLADHVRRAGPLPEGELARLAASTLTALITIHSAKVVHHDIKPGNVLLGPDGARLVDFGIATAVGTQSAGADSPYGVLATPAFMAPEQLGPGASTPASDVFAWAATMTFAATGRSPFHAPEQKALLYRLEKMDPDLAGVPVGIRPLLRICLAKDPALRPSAQQALARLLTDLQPAADTRPGSGTGPDARLDPIFLAEPVPGSGSGEEPQSVPVPVGVPQWGSPSAPAAPTASGGPAAPPRVAGPPPPTAVPPGPLPMPFRPRPAGRLRRFRKGAPFLVVPAAVLIWAQTSDHHGAAQVRSIASEGRSVDNLLARGTFGATGHLFTTLDPGGRFSWLSAEAGAGGSGTGSVQLAGLPAAGPTSAPRPTSTSPEGRFVAVASGARFGIWSTADGRRLADVSLSPTDTVRGLSLDREGTRVAVTWVQSDGRALTRIASVADHGWLGDPIEIERETDVALSPKGDRLLYTPQADDRVAVRDVDQARDLARMDGCRSTGQLAFGLDQPDIDRIEDATLAFCIVKGDVYTWDLLTGTDTHKVISMPSGESALQLAVRPDGWSVVVLADDGSGGRLLESWEPTFRMQRHDGENSRLPNRTQSASMALSRSDEPGALAISPDGQRLALITLGDHTGRGARMVFLGPDAFSSFAVF